MRPYQVAYSLIHWTNFTIDRSNTRSVEIGSPFTPVRSFRTMHTRSPRAAIVHGPLGACSPTRCDQFRKAPPYLPDRIPLNLAKFRIAGHCAAQRSLLQSFCTVAPVDPAPGTAQTSRGCRMKRLIVVLLLVLTALLLRGDSRP